MPPNTTATTGDTATTGATSVKSGRKKGRKARLVVLVLVLAIIGGIAYGAYWSISTVRASFPQTTGSIKLDGLSGPVDVKRDGYGIPQIYASSDEDLFMAQGYVQAQDRFYEMDVRRHMTSGRLSEMFGKSQVENDEFLRTLGWDRIARQEYDTKLSDSTKKYLQAYAKGVNAYLQGKEGKDISLEYAALGFTNDYKPGKWTPVDSVSWLKAMAWDLRGNMQDEIDRALMAGRLGPQQIQDLYPAYPYGRNKPIVQEGRYDELNKAFQQGGGSSTEGTAGGTSAQGATGSSQGTTGTTGSSTTTGTGPGLTSQLGGLYKVLDGLPTAVGVNGQGIGSNSWVVAGKYTITGKPLLANDPHLSASPAVRLVPDGPALPDRLRQVPVRRHRLHLCRYARCDHRPQRQDRLGYDQLRRRRHRPLPGEGQRERLPVRRQGQALQDPRGDHPGRRRQGQDDRRTPDPGRDAAPVRP
ncbi:hypothetical protein GCM10017687_47950 [Streptomyces echinatus]